MEILFDMVLRQAQYDNHKKIGTNSRTFGTDGPQGLALQKKRVDHLTYLRKSEVGCPKSEDMVILPYRLFALVFQF